MTRAEQIVKAAAKCYTNIFRKNAFITGAEWADKNPDSNYERLGWKEAERLRKAVSEAKELIEHMSSVTWIGPRQNNLAKDWLSRHGGGD